MVGIFAVMIVVVNIVTTSEKFCSLYIPVKQRFDFITILQISLESIHYKRYSYGFSDVRHIQIS